MLEVGKGPKAALLCAGGSRDVRGCREGSKALTLGHWRWIDTLPGKLKRGGIINKSASMGLRVKRVATERDQPANGWSPTTNDVAALNTTVGREKHGSTEGKQLFVHSYRTDSH